LIGLDWIGLDWIGLDWIGLDWIGLKVDTYEQVGLIGRVFQEFDDCSCADALVGFAALQVQRWIRSTAAYRD